ncbi:MAG: hypothetical protein HZY76_00135 [Anaerolineae bacterium]|nr:MAG: hypothetical protein HZY76_00135 [Anaerolineae bacterium]
MRRSGGSRRLETFGDYFTGWDIAQTRIYLGEAYLQLGEEPAAQNILLDALRLAREIHSAPLMLQALAGLAALERPAPLAAGWLSLILSHPRPHTPPKNGPLSCCAAWASPPPLDEATAIAALETTVDAVIGG